MAVDGIPSMQLRAVNIQVPWVSLLPTHPPEPNETEPSAFSVMETAAASVSIVAFRGGTPATKPDSGVSMSVRV